MNLIRRSVLVATLVVAAPAAADLNGGGRADICGRGSGGINCARSGGSSFGSVYLWSTNFNDANAWNSGPEYYSTISFPDLNGDGKADVCGRGGLGINCALSGGSGFGSVTLWSTNFSDEYGWNSGPEYYSTISFPDLNGDGRADVCGRGSGGINCALSFSSNFGSVYLWSTNFSNEYGWNSGPEYYSTISFPDLNGDGKADVCGRGSGGINCALSSGSGFGSAILWSTNFSDEYGWNSGPEYYSTISFPDLNGDGKADVCGRGSGGINCALSTGFSFGSVNLWSTNFSNESGWNSGPEYYSTISFPDLNGDGKADVCGRGSGGINCALSSGFGFGSVNLWSTNFSDEYGWSSAPAYYSTISFSDLNGDGKEDVCGRGGAGIHCALSSGFGFGSVNLWSTNFSDEHGWNSGPEYYGTIRLIP